MATACRIAQFYIRGFSEAIKVCAIYNRKNSKEFYAIYGTNSLELMPYYIYELSRKRWHIEEMFRDLKQNLSFGKLPCTGQTAAELSICLPCLLLAYIRLYPEEWDQRSDQPKTIGSLVAKVKEQNFSMAIGYLVKGSGCALQAKMRSRRHADRLRQKPVDNAAADRLEVA